MTLGEGADYPDIVKRDVIVVADFINANVQSGSVWILNGIAFLRSLKLETARNS